MTQTRESCHAMCGARAHNGWLRLVGSLKLKVSLQNMGLFCRALSQKRSIILRSLLIVATNECDSFVYQIAYT